MQDILSHHQINPSLLPLFLDHADGVAALALLCNAAAMDNLAFYCYKADLVALACIVAGREQSWVDWHDSVLVFFIETELLLDGELVQVSFHFPGDDYPDLAADWPRANGRGWRGQRVQARAAEIAHNYLVERGAA